MASMGGGWRAPSRGQCRIYIHIVYYCYYSYMLIHAFVYFFILNKKLTCLYDVCYQSDFQMLVTNPTLKSGIKCFWPYGIYCRHAYYWYKCFSAFQRPVYSGSRKLEFLDILECFTLPASQCGPVRFTRQIFMTQSRET